MKSRVSNPKVRRLPKCRPNFWQWFATSSQLRNSGLKCILNFVFNHGVTLPIALQFSVKARTVQTRYTVWICCNLQNLDGYDSVTRCWTKKKPSFSKRCPKSSPTSLTENQWFSHLPKVNKHLGYFYNKKLPRNSKNCPILSQWVTNYWKSFYYFATQLHFAHGLFTADCD